MTSTLRRAGALVLLAAWAGTAAAHPDHGAGAGFLQGLAHPVDGLDHLLAMLAVGLWSVRSLAAGRRWIGPAAFVLAMLSGAALALSGVAMPMLEAGVAASVVLLGLMLLPAWSGLGTGGVLLVALAGLAHGMAHGVAAPSSWFASYALGLVLCTGALHAAGLGAGVLMREWRAGAWRAVSALTAVAGLGLLVARF